MNAKLLVEGEEAFSYIFEKFENAKKHIFINMFIWRFDRIGLVMAEHVIKAADRGILVHIVKDKLGGIFEIAEESRKSFFHHDLGIMDRAKAYGIHKGYPMKGKGKVEKIDNPLLEAMKKHPNIILDVDQIKSDHSKYYIIDNEILIMGGINIEDKEIYKDTEGKTYHDYMIGIEDAEVVELFNKRLSGELAYHPDRPIDFIFNIFNDGRDNTLEAGELIKGVKAPLLKFIRNAKSQLDITMAYLGDQDIIEAIGDAANLGIAVNLMIPAKANLQQDTNLRLAKELLQTTDNQIKVYLNPKMVHGKLMLVDGTFLTFGSSNFNKSAMNNLAELNICLSMESSMADELEKTLHIEYKKSILIKNYQEIRYNRVKAFIEKRFC